MQLFVSFLQSLNIIFLIFVKRDRRYDQVPSREFIKKKKKRCHLEVTIINFYRKRSFYFIFNFYRQQVSRGTQVHNLFSSRNRPRDPWSLFHKVSFFYFLFIYFFIIISCKIIQK